MGRLADLHTYLISVGIPVEGLYGTGDPYVVTVRPEELQAQAQPVIDAFDFSEAAAKQSALEQFSKSDEPAALLVRGMAKMLADSLTPDAPSTVTAADVLAGAVDAATKVEP